MEAKSLDVESLGDDETVEGQIYDSYLVNGEHGDNDEIHLWALDRKSKPLLLRIEDFPIFCHLGLPLNNHSGMIEWNESNTSEVVSYLKRVLGDDGPIKSLFTLKIPIYYYQHEEKAPMMVLIFKTVEAMNHCSKLLRKPIRIGHLGELCFELLESKISPITKMFTLRDCNFSQCVRITGKKVDVEHEKRISKPGIDEFPISEYIVDWKTMIPLNDELEFVTYPRILSFDWEMNSENILAFPNSLLVTDDAYLGSFVYQILGKPETRKKYVVLVGDCEDIEGVEIIKVENEIEAIYKMCDIINKVDPDLVIGYNISGFDVPYLDDRLLTMMKTWPNCGRLLGKLSTIEANNWKSSAYGEVEIKNLKMEGRVSIDVLTVIKRDYKLRTYGLGAVSSEFLGITKLDMPPKEMFRIRQQLRDATEKTIKKAVEEMTRLVEYAVRDSDLTLDLFEHLNIWIGLVEMSNIVRVTITQIFTRGQQVRCLSQLYDLASRKGVVITSRPSVNMHAVGGLVDDPISGLYDNIACLDFASLYPSIMISHNICYTTLVRASQTENYPDEKAHIIEFTQEEPISEVKQNIPSDEKEDSDDDEDKKEIKTVSVAYKFKFVKEEVRKGLIPELSETLIHNRGKVKKEIKVLSTKLKKILKFRDLLSEAIKLREYIDKVDEEEEKTDSAKLKKLRVDIKNLNEEEKVSYLTSQVKLLNENLMKARNEIDDLNIAETNLENFLLSLDLEIKRIRLKLVILDKKQLAIKVSGNSFYGFICAQHKGMLPLIEGGVSTTAVGRKLVTEMGAHMRKNNYETVYGDTDSAMCSMNTDNGKVATERAKQLSIDISGTPKKTLPDGTVIPAKRGIFPPGINAEFEKLMKLLCFKKKKYAYYEYDEEGNFILDLEGLPKLNSKGIVLARRDNCRFLQRIYKILLRKVLDGRTFFESFRSLISFIHELITGKVVVGNELTIVKKLGSDYKLENFPMKLFSEELRRIGRPISPGDRPEYVVVITKDDIEGKKTFLGNKMRLFDMWKEIQEDAPNAPYPKEDIDYMYYLDKMIKNPIDQLLSVGYKQFLDKYDKVGYTPKNSRKEFSSIINPVKMIIKMIDDLQMQYSALPRDRANELISRHLMAYPDWLESLKVE